MAEPKPKTAEAASSAAAAASTPKNEGNPAFRAMGLPRLRKRLPSRNWMIFFGIVGSFSGAVIYDKRETRKIQQKYCNAVSHLADEQLGALVMPRKIKIFLEAPPGDYLLSARDYFKEYVKPILVASAVDWEVFEGRKEGDIRYKLAETIREKRRKAGEGIKDGSEEPDIDDIVSDIRTRAGISASMERGGDLVIGRHTWKEYVRGLHEGWLGPAESMKKPQESSDPEVSPDTSGKPGEISDLAANVVKNSSTFQANVSVGTDTAVDHENGTGSESQDDASAKAEEEPLNSETAKTGESKKKDDEKKLEPDLTIPLLRPDDFHSASLATTTPEAFAPAVAVGFPHILGFLNTPIRIWRFLHRRRIAESTGAAVTAFILASEDDIRPFVEDSFSLASSQDGSADLEDEPSSELNRTLKHEERNWHKSARKPNETGQEDKERPWQEDMVVESRLTSRMRTIDIESFIARSGLSAQSTAGPTDLAGSAVVNAAGNVLAGSSGGEEPEDGALAHHGPKQIAWKGAADRLDPVSWVDFLKSALGMKLDKRPKPWQHGFEGFEED